MTMKSGDITVSHGKINDTFTTVISDKGSNREWSGESKSNHDEASTEATRKFLSDRRSPEYVK